MSDLVLPVDERAEWFAMLDRLFKESFRKARAACEGGWVGKVLREPGESKVGVPWRAIDDHAVELPTGLSAEPAVDDGELVRVGEVLRDYARAVAFWPQRAVLRALLGELDPYVLPEEPVAKDGRPLLSSGPRFGTLEGNLLHPITLPNDFEGALAAALRSSADAVDAFRRDDGSFVHPEPPPLLLVHAERLGPEFRTAVAAVGLDDRVELAPVPVLEHGDYYLVALDRRPFAFEQEVDPFLAMVGGSLVVRSCHRLKVVEAASIVGVRW